MVAHSLGWLVAMLGSVPLCCHLLNVSMNNWWLVKNNHHKNMPCHIAILSPASVFTQSIHATSPLSYASYLVLLVGLPMLFCFVFLSSVRFLLFCCCYLKCFRLWLNYWQREKGELCVSICCHWLQQEQQQHRYYPTICCIALIWVFLFFGFEIWFWVPFYFVAHFLPSVHLSPQWVN